MFIRYFIFITTPFNPFGMNYSLLKRPYGEASSGGVCLAIEVALIECVLRFYLFRFLAMMC